MSEIGPAARAPDRGREGRGKMSGADQPDDRVLYFPHSTKDRINIYIYVYVYKVFDSTDQARPCYVTIGESWPRQSLCANDQSDKTMTRKSDKTG